MQPRPCSAAIRDSATRITEKTGLCRRPQSVLCQTDAEFVMPLNPDTEITRGYLRALMTALDDPNVAACTGKMLRFETLPVRPSWAAPGCPHVCIRPANVKFCILKFPLCGHGTPHAHSTLTTKPAELSAGPYGGSCIRHKRRMAHYIAGLSVFSPGLILACF